ncbi:MAG: TIGR01210 family radical SAM protein [Asgard group archaeon]|nr:TIGR01210 family radical SAM protein [Asgard group archaeon]
MTKIAGIFTKQICNQRKKSLIVRKKRESSDAIACWVESDFLLNGPGEALVIILNSKGCQWGMGSFGGCSMCGYSNETTEDITATDLINQAEKAFDIFSKKNFQAIKIFNSGSFLDDNEIPIEAQEKIFKMANNFDKVTEIIIESRPEFVSRKNLNFLKDILDDNKQLEIGIGLESSNDFIRLNYINKGFLLSDYTKAVKNALKEQVRVKSYLLLKPPLLTEQEAINDTYQSIIDAIKIGSRSISINPVNIQKGTFVHELWRNGLYRSPWFWSVRKVLKDAWETINANEINHLVDRILCDPSGTGTFRSIHNCFKCNKQFIKSLKDYSINQNLSALDTVTCNCYEIWQELLYQEQATRDLTLSKLEKASDYL